MNLISTAWSCARCGAAYISTPPEHGLCDQCLADLQAIARLAPIAAQPCPACGGAVCIRQSTFASTYAPKVRNRIIPGLGKHRLDRLTPEHVERFYTRLEAEGLTPATVLQIHRVLARAQGRHATGLCRAQRRNRGRRTLCKR